MNRFTESIWGDEGFSAILSMKSVPDIIHIIINDTSPPLWNLTEHFAFQIFGTGEVVIRGLAFSYFLLTVYFAYLIGKLIWNNKTGLLAAALTFLNPFFFTYAFEGRMYSIMTAGVTGAMYFFLRLLKGDKKTSTQVGFVFFNLWALYSHHFAIFMLFIQGFWYLVYLLQGKREIAGRLFKLFIVTGIGYLPWIYPLYHQTKMVGGGFWLGKPNTKDLFDLYGKYIGSGTSHSLRPVILTLSLVVLATRKWLSKLPQELVLASWFVGPIALTWLVSQIFQPVFYDRYLLYTIPGVTILMASAANKVTNKILIALVALLLIVNVSYFTHPTKRPFKELATLVNQTRQPGDKIINWYSNGTHHLWETKYYAIGGPIYTPEGADLPFFVGTALMEPGDLTSTLPANAHRIGVVTSGPLAEVDLPGYKLVEPIELSGLSFGWYQK